MYNCQELTRLVTDYLEGKLPFWDRFRFRLHLLACAHCRAYIRQMRLTIRTLGKLPDTPIPPATMDALMKEFKNWKK